MCSSDLRENTTEMQLINKAAVKVALKKRDDIVRHKNLNKELTTAASAAKIAPYCLN